jgi:hypothetical protein
MSGEKRAHRYQSFFAIENALANVVDDLLGSKLKPFVLAIL